MILNDDVVLKMLRMFSPATSDFLNFPASDVVHGPDDRALIGCSTSFPKTWLIEDFGFTSDEADAFISAVKAANVEIL